MNNILIQFAANWGECRIMIIDLNNTPINLITSPDYRLMVTDSDDSNE